MIEPKAKVGDKVKVIDDGQPRSHSLEFGCIGEVMEVDLVFDEENENKYYYYRVKGMDCENLAEIQQLLIDSEFEVI